MPDSAVVSIQESTTGAISALLEAEGCECLQSIKLLAYLAGALQRYEEEGNLLTFDVLLCNSIERISKSIPGGRFLVVGTAQYTSETGKQVLKQCATLARAGWTVFIERQSTLKVRFGVMSFLANPTSVTLREMVTLERDLLVEADFAVLVERVDPRTVIFSGASRNSLKIAFSTTRQVRDDTAEVGRFASVCCRQVEEPEFLPFFRGLLIRALNESHGTILICQAEKPLSEIRDLNDAVLLTPPVSLAEAFRTFRATRDADSLLELQRSESLITGMLQSDGIVVFSSSGEIIAYRVFFRSSAESTKLLVPLNTLSDKTKTATGGARRRAFEGLKSLVGNEIQGALFRSQDGATEFEGV